jgi:SAM-dependent methyltransferase
MRDKFAGGDPDYIRTRQYGTTDNLLARANLHQRYATAPVPWFEWMVAQVSWCDGPVVEAGCGAGALWEEGRPPVDRPVVLTDLSAGMVTAAISMATSAGYEVEGRVAAAQQLPVPGRACAHVISNHMLYHVPEPPRAVAEFARVLADDGLLTVATNGERHMAGLKEIEHEVFGTRVAAGTVDAFGLTNGRAMLEAEFDDVELRRFPDALHVTSPDDALAYLISYPPGEDATPEQRAALTELLDAAFVAGGGTLVIEKDVGLFLCRGPRRN